MGSVKQAWLAESDRQKCQNCNQWLEKALLCGVCGKPVEANDNCGTTEMDSNHFEAKES
jgi:predicted amidophosphoribosyltransferase